MSVTPCTVTISVYVKSSPYKDYIRNLLGGKFSSKLASVHVNHI